ncbi:hypothetical protein [Halomontanus rarus]|uniref:hypothetical protein n=1 Tax=Halomontanus rarus TaxID=3034020 RepID=UPI0023E8B442|nr:hypothetical protein [Halovivax sp. TS33]
MNDTNLDYKLTLTCTLPAIFGWVMLMMGISVARTYDPARFERYAGDLTYWIELGIVLAIVLGLALFVGFVMIWFALADSTDERKRQFIQFMTVRGRYE